MAAGRASTAISASPPRRPRNRVPTFRRRKLLRAATRETRTGASAAMSRERVAGTGAAAGASADVMPARMDEPNSAHWNPRKSSKRPFRPSLLHVRSAEPPAECLRRTFPSYCPESPFRNTAAARNRERARRQPRVVGPRPSAAAPNPPPWSMFPRVGMAAQCCRARRFPVIGTQVQRGIPPASCDTIGGRRAPRRIPLRAG